MPVPLVILITDLDLGGTPLMVRALANGLKARGHFDPTVVSIRPISGTSAAAHGAVARMLRADGVAVESLNIARAAQLPAALLRWVRLLHRRRPVIVHSFLVHANALATLGRSFAPPAQYIQAIHSLQTTPHWHWWLQGILSGFADGFVAPHPEILHRVARYGSFNRARIIPNGIDLQRFSPTEGTHFSPIAPPFPHNPRTIGYIGRFDPVKRLPELINAFAIIRKTLPLDDLRLILVGYGPQEAQLRQQADALGLHDSIDFPGPTNAPEEWYKLFDVLCLPSDAEGFGLTVVEALATGIPVVAINTPAMQALIPTNTIGILIHKAVPELLASALIEVMNTPTMWSKSHIAARRELSNQYSQEQMIVAYENYLRNFVAH